MENNRKMAVDISGLGNLTTSEPLDMDTYADSKESTFQLPEKGRYIVRAPESFPPTAFGSTQLGHLKIQVDPTIVGPKHENFTIRFTNISAKPFERSGARVSQVGDYLRACGRRGSLPGDPQAIADAVAATAGTTYQVDIDWKAYNKTTGFSVVGMNNFPKTADGKPQPWVEDPGDTDENGSPKRLRANIEVKRYVPA